MSDLVMGDGTEDRIVAEQEAAEYRAEVRAQVEAFHAAYRAETERLIEAGLDDEMGRAMSAPRICHSCAKVWPGGGHCVGTPEHPHPEVTLYASNN